MSFGKVFGWMGEYLNTDARGKQFGKVDVYDIAKLNFARRMDFDSTFER